MFKFLLNILSKRMLSKQTANYSNLFSGINNNINKLVLIDIGGAGGL